MSEHSFLRVENLSVTFPPKDARLGGPVFAVRGVSWTLEKGEILGIVGESGSGKSVSTSAIPSLLPAHAEVTGDIFLEGKQLVGLPTEDIRSFRGRRIGMIFQEPGRSYDPLQNIGSVFHETLANARPGISRLESEEEAIRLLTEVGLPQPRERLGNYPHQFSGGQLQRIGIALALAQGCDLLIADEPTTALDVTIQAQIVALLKRIRDDRAISILFISHNIDLVATISDRILVMYGGLVMEEGPTRQVLASPAHPYTAALLAAAPRFDSHYSTSPLLSIPGKVPDPSRPLPGCPFAPRCSRVMSGCRTELPPLQWGPQEADESLARSWRCVFDREEVRL